jgi:hypothetical protein
MGGDIGLPQIGGDSQIVGGGGAVPQALHPVTIALPNGKEVGGLQAPRSAVDELMREARDSENYSIGRKPSWYRGK